MKIQKLIALLLALVMVLALAACGNDDVKKDDGDKDPTTSTTAPKADPTDPPADPTDPPADPTDPPADKLEGLAKEMVGIWTTDLVFDGEMMGVPAFTGTLKMSIAIGFLEDGTYSMAMDTDSFNASIEENKDALAAGILQLLYDELGGEDEAEKQCQANLGMSCTEYAAAYVESLKDELSMDDEKGTWSVEGAVMLLDDEKVNVTIKGDEMTWTGEPVEMAFGAEEIVFVRVVD